MAIVRSLEFQPLQVEADHTDTTATYTIVTGRTEERFLQIDTYASAARKIAGKKSQSIRFSLEALSQVDAIIRQHFPSAI